MTKNKTSATNRHQPYYYKNPNSDVGILMVHGIFASPIQFIDTADLLQKAGFSVKTILLPGHGSDVHCFSSATIKQWENAVKSAIHELSKEHSKIILIGHSLGSLLVLNQSMNHKISGIVLLSPPIRTKVSLTSIKMSLQILFVESSKDNEWLQTYRSIYSMDKCKPYQLVKCTQPMLNILRLSKLVQRNLGEYKVPALIIQSSLDETVRVSSMSILEKSLPNVMDTLILEKSRHCYIDSSELQIYNDKIVNFINTVTK